LSKILKVSILPVTPSFILWLKIEIPFNTICATYIPKLYIRCTFKSLTLKYTSLTNLHWLTFTNFVISCSMKKIQMVDLKGQYKAIKDAVNPAIQEIIENTSLLMDQKFMSFKKILKII